MRYLASTLSFLMVSGCSTLSYSGRPVTVPKIETMPVWRTEGPVTVGVDPYIQSDRQKEVFDDDLGKVGVLPIYLLVRNNSDRKLSLRRRSEIPLADIALELPDGTQISPVQPDTVLRTLNRPITPHTPQIQSGEDAAVLFYFFPLLPFAIPLAIAGKRATEARIADYMKKEFQDAVLSKDDSTHGFVFFMPSSTPWALKGKLLLGFEDTDGTDFVVRLPIILNYEP